MTYTIPLPTEQKDIDNAIELYNEYKDECNQSGEKPKNFVSWYDVTFYYDYMDSND